MAYNSKYTGAQVEALLDRAGDPAAEDTELSMESINTVQNKVVTAALNDKAERMTVQESATLSVVTLELNAITAITGTFGILTVNPPASTPTGKDIALEAVLRFATGDTAPTVQWADNLRWPNGKIMEIRANRFYEFSVVYDHDGWNIVGRNFAAVTTTE